ncbi:MAG: hypothetical protein AB8B82_07255 [Roseovarius sp.]
MREFNTFIIALKAPKIKAELLSIIAAGNAARLEISCRIGAIQPRFGLINYFI